MQQYEGKPVRGPNGERGIIRNGQIVLLDQPQAQPAQSPGGLRMVVPAPPKEAPPLAPRYADDAAESRANAGVAAATAPDRIGIIRAQRRAAEAAAAKAEREGGARIDPAKLHAVRLDAANKINTIRQIRTRLSRMSHPNVTGAGLGDLLKHVPGTPARGIAAQIGSLKAGGALAEVLKISQETGKNPFTPMSNSDVELISRNVGNLDQGQSVEDLIGQLDAYERAYGNGFVGAGGNPRKLRDKNRADGPWPGKRGGQRPRVIDFNDLDD